VLPDNPGGPLRAGRADHTGQRTLRLCRGKCSGLLLGREINPMIRLLTASLREVIAVGCLSLAILCAVASFVPWFQREATRLSGIFIIVGMALMAENAWVYLAAVFIVATAVTELEFLHTLAAILRGNRAYFDFKKELLTKAETEQKLQREHFGHDAPRALAGSLSESDVRRGLLIEQLAIRRLERDLNARVERGVRFSRGPREVVVDGVASGDRYGRDQIVEVKWIEQGLIDHMVQDVPSLMGLVLDYREVTGRDAYLVLVVVTPRRGASEDEGMKRLREVMRRTKENWTLYVYSYADIGLPLTDPNMAV
jgi:hypothetical protein